MNTIATRWTIWGIALLLVLVSACHAQEPNFATRASKLTEAKWSRHSIHNLYLWLTAKQLLVPNYRLYDLATGKATGLNIERFRATSLLDFPVRASPDGQWLLWTSIVEKGAIFGSRLDGAGYFKYVPQRYVNGASMPRVFWTEDSRHWVALMPVDKGRTVAKWFDVNTPDKPVMLSVVDSNGDVGPGKRFINPNDLYFVRNKRLLSCDWHSNAGVTQELEIVEIGIGIAKDRLRTRYLKFPPNTVLQQVAISPNADHVAWIAEDRVRPRIDFTSHNASPVSADDVMKAYEKFYQEAPLVSSLWISKLDGTQRRQLGQVVIRSQKEERFHDLAWLPDGKQVSVICGGFLWKVPLK